MPLPLTNRQFHRVRAWSFAPGAIWRRPRLAHHVMLVIEHWAHIDAMILQAGARCVEGEIATTMAMLQAISQTAQQAAVLAAAKTNLQADDFVIFQEALFSIGKARELRNKFAHHLWGVSNELLDALLQQNPKDANTEYARIATYNRKRAAGKSLPPPIQDDRSTIFVWTEDDFLEAVEGAERARNIVISLYAMVGLPRSRPAADSIRQRLSTEPQIRKRLDSQSKKKPQ